LADLAIDIAWRLRRDWRAVPLLRRVARHAAWAEGYRRGSISVAVVGRRAMATLHARHLGRSGPTDVLSFDLGTDRARRLIEAEVIVCGDLARQRSRPAGGTLAAARRELALYVVHGVLHVCGYDDRTPSTFAHMHAREDVLLKALGLGAVFRDGEQR
jgi:probable rRNA maturation factor